MVDILHVFGSGVVCRVFSLLIFRGDQHTINNIPLSWENLVLFSKIFCGPNRTILLFVLNCAKLYPGPMVIWVTPLLCNCITVVP